VTSGRVGERAEHVVEAILHCREVQATSAAADTRSHRLSSRASQ
jgi:hypothetical protein